MRFLSDTKLIGGPVPGRSASVNVGSTSTGLPGSAAAVSNSGSSNAAVLNFTIPSGVVGPQGAPGTPGSVTVAGLGDATTISRRVVTTATGGSGVANGANTWAKLVALSPGVNGSSHLLLGISTGVSYQPQSAIISVYAYQGSPSPAVPTVAVQIIGMPNSGPAFLQDGFKLVNNGHLAPVELWIKKSDQYTSFNVTEISRSTAAASVTYNDGAAWQAAEPVGSALNTRSTGVTVGGVPVVTTTGAQALTNKTISGATNTITSLPASATPDAARRVRTVNCTTTGHWAKILTLNAASPYFRFHAMYSVSGFARGGAIVSVDMGTLASGQVSGAVSILSRAVSSLVADDSFKIVCDGYGSPFELWFKSNAGGSVAYFYEISKINDNGVVFDTATTQTATEPVGTVLNVVSAGVTVDGIPVVTTTGSQALTNKTLTSPSISTPAFTQGNENYIKDNSGNNLLLLGKSSTSAVNYVQVNNAAAGLSPNIYASGSDTNISLNLIPKGTGFVQINGNPAGVKVAVPATATSTGVVGQWAADASWHYVCTATNTWRRAALSTW